MSREVTTGLSSGTSSSSSSHDDGSTVKCNNSSNSSNEEEEEDHRMPCCTTTTTTNTTTKYLNNPNEILNARVEMKKTSSVSSSPGKQQEQQTVCYESMEEIVKVLCPFLFPKDDNTTNHNISNTHTHRRCLDIKPLSGGLSNLIYLASAASVSVSGTGSTTTTAAAATTPTVLIRIHPDVTPTASTSTSTSTTPFSVVNREQEANFSAWLATQHYRLSPPQQSGPQDSATATRTLRAMAPRVYGRFVNGRIEEYYPQTVPLSCRQMHDYAPDIADTLAAFHLLDAPPTAALPRPNPSSSLRETGIHASWYDSIRAYLKQAMTTTTTLTKDNNPVFADKKNHAEDEKDDETKELFIQKLQQEWTWLEHELASYPQQQQQRNSKSRTTSPSTTTTGNDEGDNAAPIVHEALHFIRQIVVTHMDCQPLNILINTTPTIEKNNEFHNNHKNNNIRLVDFEYAGWNPIVSSLVFSVEFDRISHGFGSPF